jgi:hypothetical protein
MVYFVVVSTVNVIILSAAVTVLVFFVFRLLDMHLVLHVNLRMGPAGAAFPNRYT